MEKSSEKATSVTVTQAPQCEAGKKSYARPQLVEYGNIAKLTQSGLTGTTDGLLPMNCL